MSNESVAPMPNVRERSSWGRYLRTKGKEGRPENEKSARDITKRGTPGYVSNISKRGSPGGSLTQSSRQLCFSPGPWVIVTHGSLLTEKRFPKAPANASPISSTSVVVNVDVANALETSGLRNRG